MRSSISSFSVLRRARFLTRVIRAMSSTGLVRKSSAPASSPCTLSEAWSSAVTMTTGTCRVLGALLMRRQTSKPSMPGIITSSSTTSTRSASSTSSASLPECAVSTSKYSADKRASSSLTLARDVVNDENATQSSGTLNSATQPNAQASPRYRRTVSRKVPIEIGLEM